MNRRSLLRSFFVAPQGAALVDPPRPAWAKQSGDIEDGPHELKGHVIRGNDLWKVRWTGWKSCANQDAIVAQWLAYPVHPGGKRDLSRHQLYASIPGSGGAFCEGQMLNTDYQSHRHWIGQSTPDAIRLREKNNALCALMDMIQSHNWKIRLGEPSYGEIASDIWIKFSPETKWFLDADRCAMGFVNLVNPRPNGVPDVLWEAHVKRIEHNLEQGRKYHFAWKNATL